MRRAFIHISAVSLLLALTATAVRGSVHVEDEEIVFLLGSPGADRVYVVGDFNGWNPTMDRLIEIEGRFEIRLYLVPGRYRYRFIVDGDSIPDPDNPNRDADGNSLFRIAETPDGLEITFDGVGREAKGAADELSLLAELSATAGDYRDALHAAARIEGRRGERVEARLTVGYEVTIRGDEVRKGEALFTQAAGIYNFEKGRLEAFTRDADLDFHDPAALFGPSGIYRYPLGSLCRGLLYEGRFPLGVEGKAFYANRLRGPVDGFEESWGSSAGVPFDSREIIDSDIMGLKLGSKLWKTRFAYLMRSVRRPYPSPWAVPDLPDVSYEGYERDRVDGFVVSLEGYGPITFESEILFGGSHLESIERWSAGEPDGEPYEAEWEWQNGVRLYSGIRYRGDRGRFLLAIDRTTLDGDPGLGETAERITERMTALCAAGINVPFGYIGARGAVERYGSAGDGSLFWLDKGNFFLDGDEITIGRLPFMESGDLYELEIRFVQPTGTGVDGGMMDERSTGIRFEPFALPLVASFTEWGDRGGGRVRELRFSKGADLHDRIRFFADARYVSYRVDGWEGESDYLDLFIAARGRINDRSWISLGIGVDPSIYDGWRYGHTGYGRERYLVDRGILESGISKDELLGALEEAERSLSEEWSITFEAFVRFW